MTHFLRDILRQPAALLNTLDYLHAEGSHRLNAAVDAVRNARHVYLTGIGSSWHAALSAQSLFSMAARPVHAQDAAELLHFSAFPQNCAVIVISRTGRSAEIVHLLPKARQANATVIGLTNDPNGTLAHESQIPLVVPVAFDHAISVNTYTSLALAAAVLATNASGSFDAHVQASLSRALQDSAQAFAGWQQQVENSNWLAPGSVHYFLARGSSLSSCHEARLLWEEGVKSPATAMGTASFRHGPQEIVEKGTRFGIWIDSEGMRAEDLALARDLRRLGASVMLVGQNVPSDAADLVFQLPSIPAEWQFLIDIMPVQLVAERLARISGADPDSFRLCSYVVEDESGLLPEELTEKKQ